jgi:hypothetical protein
MKQYLLSIYQPDSDPPPANVLAEICAMDVRVDEELRPAGAWVFSGGLHAPLTGHRGVLTPQARSATTRLIPRPSTS